MGLGHKFDSEIPGNDVDVILHYLVNAIQPPFMKSLIHARFNLSCLETILQEQQTVDCRIMTRVIRQGPRLGLRYLMVMKH